MPAIRIVMPNGTTKSFREGTPNKVIRQAIRDMQAEMAEQYGGKKFKVVVTGNTPTYRDFVHHTVEPIGINGPISKRPDYAMWAKSPPDLTKVTPDSNSATPQRLPDQNMAPAQPVHPPGAAFIPQAGGLLSPTPPVDLSKIDRRAVQAIPTQPAGPPTGGNFDAKRAEEIRRYWRDHRDAILHTAEVTGIPATAIAAAPAEEYRVQNRFTNGLLDAFGNARLGVSGRNQNAMNGYHDLKPAIDAGTPVQNGAWGKFTNPMEIDVGIGNFNPAVGVDLVKKYIADPKYTDDPLGLRKYDGHYDQLYRDLADPKSDATIRLTGLKLAEVERDMYSGYGKTPAQIRAGKVRQGLYANAIPAMKDKLLDEGYRTGKKTMDNRGGNQMPQPREKYYDFFEDPRSPYQDLSKILFGY